MGAVGEVEVFERPGWGVAGGLLVRAEEHPCGRWSAEPLEVHGEERRVGEPVADAQALVELQAVKDPRSVRQREDVVGEQVAMPVVDAAFIDPSVEQRPAAGEPLQDELARAFAHLVGNQVGEVT